ncbi:MAG: hypothetical protein JRI68_21225 [Deltaproteobacteria bacterium]|nr:hypothetical protein [Deltaproteobacteria bacterium]
MRAVLLALAAAMVLVPFACSSEETQTEPTTTSTSSTGGTGGSAGSGGAGGSTSGTGGAGATGGGDSGGGGGSSSGDGGSSSSGDGGGGGGSSSGNGGGSSGSGGGSGDAMTASLSASTLYVNCQPSVPPDPVIGGFTAQYDNTNGTSPALATVTQATLTMTGSGSQTLVWSFTVNPVTSGTVAAGASTQQVHQKVTNSGSGVGPGAPCNYCSGTWVLDVTWQIGGQTTNDSLNLGGVQCVN